MADRDGHLQEVPGGYAKFHQDKNLAIDKHQPYLVRWVREFANAPKVRPPLLVASPNEDDA